MVENTALFRQTVSEADIDWIVCVELNANEAFRGWMLSKIFPDDPLVQHIRAWRSISNILGETDILWEFTIPGGDRHIVLIENKIGALAQPGQYLRYDQRGKNYLCEGLCNRYSVVLLAPSKYHSRDSLEYPIRISYEEMGEWFRQHGDERSHYIELLLGAAISKVGSPAPFDKEVFEFQKQIWQLACREFPELNVPEPSAAASATQYWVYMRHPPFALIYKMYKTNGRFNDCVVDLELAGLASEVEALQQKYGQQLAGSRISVQQTGKSAAFRIQVPPIEPPHFEEDKVRRALQAARELLVWWQRANEG